LAHNLHWLLYEIANGVYDGAHATLDLLREFHARLFDGVRNHAGRIRSRDHGSEYLTFGPNRSLHRDKVPDALEALFTEVRRQLARLLDSALDPEYERTAIYVAVWAHATAIQIHPFEDGNGRSSRALMDWLLQRLGLRSIPVEVPKSEYREVLNYFYSARNITPLCDLFLRLYDSQS